MIFTVHLNQLIDENTPSEQSTIETCLQEAYKYQKVTKISIIWSRFEASWLDCVTMMSEMTIAVIVVSASCHHLTRADSGWSRISWFSRVTLPWLRGGTSVAPWRHKSSHVPVFRRLFDRLPVRISTSDLHHRILRKKLYHIRAYDFGVQFSFKEVFYTDKLPLSVDSDSICVKLPGNKVDSFKYGAKWNKYLLRGAWRDLASPRHFPDFYTNQALKVWRSPLHAVFHWNVKEKTQK